MMQTAFSFGNHHHPPLFERSRQAHLEVLVAEAARVSGKAEIRTWSDGQRWIWRKASDGCSYDYRSMLANQVTFDIGDDLDAETPRPWVDTARDTMLLWDVLNWLGIPYWGSLTDGKGTHTELFFDRIPNCGRHEFAKALIAICNACLGTETSFTNPFRCDPLLLDPNEGSRQLREFGATKEGYTPFGKALWTVGPGPYRQLSATREETYSLLAMRIRSGEPLRMPTTIPHIPVNDPLSNLCALQGFAGTQGGSCPRGAQCYPGPHRDPLDWDTSCNDCPLNR